MSRKQKFKVSYFRVPTKEAMALKKALKDRGVKVYTEFNDGYKTIDLTLPNSKIDIEVDGIQHLRDPGQILTDLSRGYYSYKDGYDTIHIQNQMIHNHLNDIADALAVASKIRERRIHIYFG